MGSRFFRGPIFFKKNPPSIRRASTFRAPSFMARTSPDFVQHFRFVEGWRQLFHAFHLSNGTLPARRGIPRTQPSVAIRFRKAPSPPPFPCFLPFPVEKRFPLIIRGRNLHLPKLPEMDIPRRFQLSPRGIKRRGFIHPREQVRKFLRKKRRGKEAIAFPLPLEPRRAVGAGRTWTGHLPLFVQGRRLPPFRIRLLQRRNAKIITRSRGTQPTFARRLHRTARFNINASRRVMTCSSTIKSINRWDNSLYRGDCFNFSTSSGVNKR
ncbi:hypothetical protein CLV97_11050 [Planifilum fimeticola]|uniref:Uncharacterized protein n=1 Tax=Planifilum fimeticola TaxID=201975 RepID=A0A2T0LF74_9BACL|nr:hypothetical protein CLV97_11050 [Planifilum fimeticola]